jgi:hypothetical protein
MKVYEQPSATDDEIRKCQGDYIGCEICRYADRCIGIKLKRIDAAIHKEEKM